MPITAQIYFKYYLLLWIFLLGMFGLGYSLYGRRHALSYANLFLSTLLGTILFSSLIALVKTGFQSIMLLYGLLLLFAWIEGRYAKAGAPLALQAKSISWNQAGLAIVVGSLALFSWSFAQYIRPEAFPYVIPNPANLSANDYIINSIRSHFLGINGMENYFHILNDLEASYKGPKPYHYIELWLNNGISTLVGGLNLVNNVLITFPLLYCISFLGFLALWEKYTWNQWWLPGLGIICLFVAGLHLTAYNKLGYYAFSLPILSHRLKMATYYPFLIGFLLLYHHRQPLYAWICLLGLFVATVVVGPALGAGILGIGMIALLLKLYPHQQAFRLLGYTITILGGILLFYALTDRGAVNIREDASAGAVVGLMQSKEMLVRLFTLKMDMFRHALAHIVVLYWPFLVVPAFFFKEVRQWVKSDQGIIPICYGLVLLFGALAFAYFHPKKDASQLYYNLAIPMMNLGGLVLMIRGLAWGLERLKGSKAAKELWINRSKIALLAGLLLFIVMRQFQFVYTKNIQPRQQYAFSLEYLTEIRDYLNAQKDTPMGVSIRGGKDYASTFSKQTFSYSLGYYLAYMRNGCLAISISDYAIPIKSQEEANDVSSGLFYQFVQKQKEENTFQSLERSQLEFLDIYGISFLILSPNAQLPAALEERIDRVIKDPKSGEAFMLLN